MLRIGLALLGICLVEMAAGMRLQAAELQAGVAVVDITPPAGYRMAGYFRERLNTGTHDPLQAKALVLRQGDEKAALVFCDLVGISRAVSDRARRLAAKKTGIPAANVLIAATHSHTGPLYMGALRQYFHEQAIAARGADPHEKIDYPSLLAEKIAEAIDRANKSARAVSLSAGMARQEGLSFNRRFHMKDGTVQFNPGKLNPNIVRPAGPTDPDVGLLRIAAGDKDVALLSVFALHLDTVGGTEYSADYPFYLERKLRPVLGATGVSLFAAGTCGDINHIDVSKKDPQKGNEEAGRIDTTLGETIGAALPKLRPLRSPNLAAHPRKEAARLLLGSWTSSTPALRREVLEALFQRGEWLMLLLEQIEMGKVQASELDPARVRQLLDNRRADIRMRARKALQKQMPEERQSVLRRYRSVLTQNGNAQRGREVFQKNCATCHRIADIGILVGPDISDTRIKTVEQLLTDILNPNAAIDSNYINYLVTTRSGKVLSGIIDAETASSITLRRAENQTDTVLRRDIEDIRSTGQSLMPEGLEKTISLSEMADLLSFLKNWRYQEVEGVKKR